ncbi:MAG: diacylglycerol kinase [Hellea sp.]|nr:diacylglycerol kinase [Hellea sp.]
MLAKAVGKIKSATTYSLQGAAYLFKSEMAARLEVYALLSMLTLFIILGESKLNFLVLIVLFLILLAVEALNTAIEVLANRVSPEISEAAKNAKDLGSLAAMFVIIAILLFIGSTLLDADLRTAANSITSPKGRTLIAIGLLFAAVYSLIKSSYKGAGKFLFSLVFALMLFGAILFHGANFFTGVGVDERVIYHLRVGLNGAGFTEYWLLICVTILSVFAVLAALVLVIDMLGRARFLVSRKIKSYVLWEGSSKNKTPMPSNKKRQFGIAVLLTGVAVLVNPITLNISNLTTQFVRNVSLESKLEFYSEPTFSVIPKKKNIIFIYLEGVERGYLDQELFPDLMANLVQLENNATSFDNIHYMWGTGWTMAGLVSTQCGVPLLTSSEANSLGNVDEFMPGAKCLGGLLKDNGYDTSFVGGSKLAFGGKGKFLKSHGFDTVKGYEYFKEKYTSAKAFSWWGLYDDYLYREILASAEKLYLNKEPFALFGLTLDTHAPNGHVTPECASIIYKDGRDKFLNSIKCSDILLNKFVKNLQSLEGFEDTIIVVASDHLSMKSDQVADVLKTKPRRNLFMILDDNDENNGTISRAGSKFDVTPTILNMFGLNKKWAFGRSLWGDDLTLLEAYPRNHTDIISQSKDILIQELWNYPDLVDEMFINLSKVEIRLKERVVKLPVIFKLDESSKVMETLFEHDLTQKKLLDYLPKQNNFLWIDECKDIIKIAEMSDETNLSEGWCWAIKNVSTGNIHAQQIKSDKETLFKKIVLKHL